MSEIKDDSIIKPLAVVRPNRNGVASASACKAAAKALKIATACDRGQLTVLRHQRAGCYASLGDCLLWASLYRLWPLCLKALVLVKPATVIKWHRCGSGSACFDHDLGLSLLFHLMRAGNRSFYSLRKRQLLRRCVHTLAGPKGSLTIQSPAEQGVSRSEALKGRLFLGQFAQRMLEERPPAALDFRLHFVSLPDIHQGGFDAPVYRIIDEFSDCYL
jgi:hypothetical protein